MKNNGIKIGSWNGIQLKENNMKLILTYKSNLSITTWFNYKHTYLLSIIGIFYYTTESDFNTRVTSKALKRIRKPNEDK